MSFGSTNVSSNNTAFYHQSLSPPVTAVSVSTFYEPTSNFQLVDSKVVEYSGANNNTSYCDLDSHNNSNIQMPTDLKPITSSFASKSGESTFATNTLNDTIHLSMTADRHQQAQQASTSGSTSPPIPECSGCMGLIQERYYLQVLEKTWHLNCLCCYDCKQSLDSQQSCFAKDGIIYCKEDYLKRFPRKCIGCSQDINSNELIMRALNSVFHIHCFKCLVCEKQLNTGEEYGIGKDNVSIFCRQHYNNFQIDYHQPLYEGYDQANLSNNLHANGQYSQDFNRPYYPVDSTNNSFPSSVFPDPYLQNHPGYNSYLCNLPPTPGISPPNSQSFHSHHQPQHHHLSLNSLNSPSSTVQSTANNSNSNPKEVKSRPKKRKASNNDTLATQSNKKIVNNKSKQSNQTAVNSSNITNGNSGIAKNNIDLSTSYSNKLVSSPPIQTGTNLNTSGLMGSVDSPDDFNNKQFDSNLDYFSDEEDDDLLDTSSSGANESAGAACHSLLNSTQSGYYDSVAAVAAAAAAAQRQKRMRTSFKHHQLRVMKSYFELNHNPDAKDLKQLSQKTGLSKRVLQVWFQNARAKFRRGQGGPECPQGQHSPNPSMNIASSGNLNNITQSASSTSSLSSNSSSLSSNSSISSDSSLQMLKKQQLISNNSNTTSLIQSNSIHHLNMDNIDESSNNDSGFSNLNNYSGLNTSHNGIGSSGNQNSYDMNSQAHIPQQIHSQPLYQHHMLQQQ